MLRLFCRIRRCIAHQCESAAQRKQFQEALKLGRPSCDGHHLVGHYQFQNRFSAKLVRETEKCGLTTRFRHQLSGSHRATVMRCQRLIPMQMQSPRFRKWGAEGRLILEFPGKCEGVTPSICRRRPRHPKIGEFGSQLQKVGVPLLALDESKSALISETILIRHFFNVQHGYLVTVLLMQGLFKNPVWQTRPPCI